MAIITVPDTDSFDQWRQKTNLLGTSIGDLILLNTTDQSSLVAAINEVITSTTGQDREILIRAIAMS